jgi:hypothetical protein
MKTPMCRGKPWVKHLLKLTHLELCIMYFFALKKVMTDNEMNNVAECMKQFVPEINTAKEEPYAVSKMVPKEKMAVSTSKLHKYLQKKYIFYITLCISL